MTHQSNSFNGTPSPGGWPVLEQMNTPMHKVLAQFIHGASEDLSNRTTAVTTLVMSLWQLAGRRMSHRLPSLVLVNAGGLDPDPIDFFASQLFAANGGTGPGIYRDGLFTGGTPEQAPLAMARAVRDMQKMGKLTVANASVRLDLEQRYFDAQRTGFGCGGTRNYGEAWHDVFSLLTDRGGELILRLDIGDDRKGFRQDVLEKSDKLRAPTGYGPGLQLVPKTTAVSGAIHAGMWDAEFAGAMAELGLPMLFLPSMAKDVPVGGNLPVLEMMSAILPRAFDTPIEEPANFIPEPWFMAYRDELRDRLRHLPADYEYSIQKLARQITMVCERIAVWSGKGASDMEVEALWLELCMHTLRGLVLSIAGLAWHGLGFDAGCSRTEALRVLQYLRDKGPMTKGELLRRAHLTKEDRDTLVDRFTAENLVQVEGKMLKAMSYSEFVAALYARKNLPEPVNLCAEDAGKSETAV